MDPRHPLYEHTAPSSRLKSRKSVKTTAIENSYTATERLRQWDKRDLFQYPANPSPSKFLLTNLNLSRKDWCALNRARCRVGRTKQNLSMRKIIQDPICDCGQEDQTMDHILFQCPLGRHCKDSDLRNATEEALAWLSLWRDKIRINRTLRVRSNSL